MHFTRTVAGPKRVRRVLGRLSKGRQFAAGRDAGWIGEKRDLRRRAGPLRPLASFAPSPANWRFATLDALDAAVARRCRHLKNSIRPLTDVHCGPGQPSRADQPDFV
jgi:hypothetical protein